MTSLCSSRQSHCNTENVLQIPPLHVCIVYRPSPLAPCSNHSTWPQQASEKFQTHSSPLCAIILCAGMKKNNWQENSKNRGVMFHATTLVKILWLQTTFPLYYGIVIQQPPPSRHRHAALPCCLITAQDYIICTSHEYLQLPLPKFPFPQDSLQVLSPTYSQCIAHDSCYRMLGTVGTDGSHHCSRFDVELPNHEATHAGLHWRAIATWASGECLLCKSSISRRGNTSAQHMYCGAWDEPGCQGQEYRVREEAGAPKPQGPTPYIPLLYIHKLEWACVEFRKDMCVTQSGADCQALLGTGFKFQSS